MRILSLKDIETKMQDITNSLESKILEYRNALEIPTDENVLALKNAIEEFNGADITYNKEINDLETLNENFKSINFGNSAINIKQVYKIGNDILDTYRTLKSQNEVDEVEINISDKTFNIQKLKDINNMLYLSQGSYNIDLDTVIKEEPVIKGIFDKMYPSENIDEYKWFIFTYRDTLTILDLNKTYNDRHIRKSSFSSYFYNSLRDGGNKYITNDSLYFQYVSTSYAVLDSSCMKYVKTDEEAIETINDMLFLSTFGHILTRMVDVLKRDNNNFLPKVENLSDILENVD